MKLTLKGCVICWEKINKFPGIFKFETKIVWGVFAHVGLKRNILRNLQRFQKIFTRLLKTRLKWL